MSKQYWENNEELASNERMINYYYREKLLSFFTDKGVFSKNEVDFGTSLLIKTIDIPASATKILDMGCGYGPIGLSLAIANQNVFFHLVDINQRAIALAKKNAEYNKIKHVEIWESNLYDRINGKYDMIISNPPIRSGKQNIFALFKGALDHLKPMGSLWIVIKKKQGAPSAFKELASLFSSVLIVESSKGYWVIKAIK